MLLEVVGLHLTQCVVPLFVTCLLVNEKGVYGLLVPELHEKY